MHRGAIGPALAIQPAHMASFSTTHPFAYHAFPLTAARSIWTTGALLGKDDQGSTGQARRTVADTDRRLGFSRYVHLYLPRRGTTPAALPILAAQLQPARDPACPHALLVVPTANLADADCSLCNWNIAVSRLRRDGPSISADTEHYLSLRTP